MQEIIAAVAFSAIATGSFTDVKMHEVPDWLNYGLLAFGMGMWLIYGLEKKDTAIIAANIAGTAFNVMLILMKYYYGRRNH